MPGLDRERACEIRLRLVQVTHRRGAAGRGELVECGDALVHEVIHLADRPSLDLGRPRRGSLAATAPTLRGLGARGPRREMLEHRFGDGVFEREGIVQRAIRAVRPFQRAVRAHDLHADADAAPGAPNASSDRRDAVAGRSRGA